MSHDFNDPTISDYEFAKRFMAAYNKELKDFDPDEYQVNLTQLQKLINLIDFFKKAAKDLGGKIDSIDIDPSSPPNGITANFIVFDIFGEDVQRFCDVLRHCSAVSMDVTVHDEVSISCTIPNVFTLK